MKNIIILGRPRSGKSTLANLLVEKYNYQVIRLDALRDSLTKIYPELNITPDSAIEDKKYFQYINKTNTLNQVRLKVFDDFIRLI